MIRPITADNGSEFLDVMGLERSNDGTGNRTRWHYAHAFASWERGSNENGNRMIRRFIPKGSDLSLIDEETIQQAEDWINRYPRKILGFQTAEERYLADVAA